MARGGVRPGQGRKSAHEEIMAKDLSQAAIISKFGSLQAGLEFLINTGEPSLLKFVFEHAIGKPVDKVEQSGGLTINWLEQLYTGE